MKLTAIEAHSALWTKIAEHLAERIAEHRRENDADLDTIQTARLRGRIKDLKYVLSLAIPDEDDPAQPAENGE